MDGRLEQKTCSVISAQAGILLLRLREYLEITIISTFRTPDCAGKCRHGDLWFESAITSVRKKKAVSSIKNVV